MDKYPRYGDWMAERIHGKEFRMPRIVLVMCLLQESFIYCDFTCWEQIGFTSDKG